MSARILAFTAGVVLGWIVSVPILLVLYCVSLTETRYATPHKDTYPMDVDCYHCGYKKQDVEIPWGKRPRDLTCPDCGTPYLFRDTTRTLEEAKAARLKAGGAIGSKCSASEHVGVWIVSSDDAQGRPTIICSACKVREPMTVHQVTFGEGSWCRRPVQ